MKTTVWGIAPLLLALTLAAGCGKKEDAKKADAKDKAATQVAAKVNAEEITVHQINAVLARNPNIPAEAAAKAKFEVLDRLIEQKIAQQQAIEKKLDRSPNVLQALEAARSDILARAYLDQVAAAQPRPTPEEVKKYYADHPELFSQRRIFNLEEIVVAPQEGLAAKLREQAAKSKNLQDVANWLTAQKIQFAPNRGVRPAEALPLDILPKIQSMKDGEIRVIENNGRPTVFRLVASKSDPVDEAKASPRIQQFLFNQKSREAATAEIKRLKGTANIEYVGEFAGGADAAAAKLKAEAEAKAKAEAKIKAETEAETKARAEAKAKAQAEADARAEEIAKARKEAEARAKRDGETKAPAAKPGAVSQETIDKGVRGLR